MASTWIQRRELLLFTIPIIYITSLLSGCPDPIQAQPVAAEGYRITSEKVVVDRAEQWQRWDLPRHAVQIDPLTHEVSLRRLRNSINIVEDMERFQVKIGNQDAYDKLLKDLKKDGMPVPLNISTAPARVAGVPIVYQKDNAKKGIAKGDPIIWYFFHGGIREAPQNAESAGFILDGNPLTYWEPNTEIRAEEYAALPPEQKGAIHYYIQDAAGQEKQVERPTYEATSRSHRRIQYNSRSLQNGYVELDLGRVVPVVKIVLRFVAPELGDPFRQFRLFSTPAHRRGASFSLLASSTAPNEDRQEVEVDLDPDGTGHYELVHRLRIAITDSKFDKFERVSHEDYFSLPAEDRGGIDYYVLDALGGETRMDEETFYRVGPQRQGQRVYYRRERPRLADVEVWAQGDNIALEVIEGGGRADLSGAAEADAGFDGLFDTAFLQPVWVADARYANRGILTLDLGAVFWLNRFRMLVDCCVRGPEMVVRSSEGNLDANGAYQWTELSRNKGEGPSIPDEGFSFEKHFVRPFPARFLNTQFFMEDVNSVPIFRIREFQVFGEGFASESILTSPLIELPPLAILGGIEWEAHIPDSFSTRVEVRTRTGDQLREIIEYYGSGGGSKTPSEYGKLPASYKGPIVTRMVPAGRWSRWSQRYRQSGERITSPSPRRFLQLQVKLLSRDPNLAPGIRSVRVDLLPAIVHQAVAEVWPDHVSLGTRQIFEVYLRPTLVEKQTGEPMSTSFDRILLDTFPLEGTELVDVQLGNEEDFRVDSAQNFDRMGWRLDPVSGEKHDWFRDESGKRFQAWVDADSGDTLKVSSEPLTSPEPSGEKSALLLQLPRPVSILRGSAVSRVYHRIIIIEGDEVPVDGDGRLLNELTYLQLPLEEQGRVLYFTAFASTSETASLPDTVDRTTYWGLEEDRRGEIRYFRRLLGRGGEVPFDRGGNPLDEAGYNALSRAERGTVLAPGELVRIRIKGKVSLNSTTLDVAIGHSNSPTTWQKADAGDATSLAPGTVLNISVPFTPCIIRFLTVHPNPFTPNGDGINESAKIDFTIGNLNIPRGVQMTIYSLNGHLVWQERKVGLGGQIFLWDGRNHAGDRVPPGLYLCQVKVDADAATAPQTTAVRVIAVAY